jgi:serine protease inhibitor
MYRILNMAVSASVLAALALPCAAEDKAAPPRKADVSAAARGNNDFTFDLYRQLARQAGPDENLFFSPYSISMALAMTYAGARGETAEQMAKVLRFDRDQDRFHPAFAELSRQIRAPGKGFKGEINVANAIWTSVDVRDPFKKVMDLHYEAGLRTISFLESEAARKTINGWVAEQTKHKIKELLPNGAVSSDTQMVLANAIYFQASWLTAFDKKQTREGKFYRTAKDDVTVPMMHLNARLRYGKVDDVEVVELPYAGGQFSMVLLLPAGHDKLAEVEKGLHRWGEWMGKLEPREVILAMPKFSLGKPLVQMGMRLPFSDSADFSGISSSGAAISRVDHEATLDVDEAGTTASAATAVGLAGSDSLPVRMTINRPFLLAVRDVREGALLFIGRVMLPNAR